MTIRDKFQLKKEDLIVSGEHNFIIEDVDLKKTPQDNEVITYITFALTEKETQKRYDNLLSLPMSKKFKFSDTGILYKFLFRMGVITTETKTVDPDMFNKLVGREFSALVVYDGQFARIDENSIVPVLFP